MFLSIKATLHSQALGASPSGQTFNDHMLKLSAIPFVFAIVFLFSCVNRNHDSGAMEVVKDSLTMFPLRSLFVSTNEDDQIALLFERDTLNTFKYRIELLRKWKGLPHDYGTLQLDKIESDTIYVFKGGNVDCEVEIRIYNDNGEFRMGRQYLRLKRNCKDNSLNIAVDEFQKIWSK